MQLVERCGLAQCVSSVNKKHLNQLGIFFKMRLLDSAGEKQGLRIYVASKLPGDADGHTLSSQRRWVGSAWLTFH